MNKVKFDLPTQIYAGVGIYRELYQYLDSNVKTLIVTDKGLVKAGIVDKVKEELIIRQFVVEVFDEVIPNPDEEMVKILTEFIKTNNIKQVIALGGGSAIDAAKISCCLATNDGTLEDYQWNNHKFENAPLPSIVIPTTAGTGSEVTGVSVISSRDIKKGINGREIFPKVAIIDAELMVSLPSFLTAITGMDALTHAIEAYVGLTSNPFTDSLSVSAIQLISKYLPRAFSNGNDLEARQNMALASTMAGIAMNQAGLGIVHAMSSPMCAYLHLSHGLANSILLPYGMEYNLIACQSKMANIAQLLGANTDGLSEREAACKAIEQVLKLQEDLDLKNVIEDSLKEGQDLNKYGENASKMFLINNNPRKATAKDCARIFTKIFSAYNKL